MRFGFRACAASGKARLISSKTRRAKPEQRPTQSKSRRYARLGECDEAFRLLEKAFAERYMDFLRLKVSPDFDNLRDDPRYRTLPGKIGLPL